MFISHEEWIKIQKIIEEEKRIKLFQHLIKNIVTLKI